MNQVDVLLTSGFHSLVPEPAVLRSRVAGCRRISGFRTGAASQSRFRCILPNHMPLGLCCQAISLSFLDPVSQLGSHDTLV